MFSAVDKKSLITREIVRRKSPLSSFASCLVFQYTLHILCYIYTEFFKLLLDFNIQREEKDVKFFDASNDEGRKETFILFLRSLFITSKLSSVVGSKTR